MRDYVRGSIESQTKFSKIQEVCYSSKAKTWAEGSQNLVRRYAFQLPFPTFNLKFDLLSSGIRLSDLHLNNILAPSPSKSKIPSLLIHAPGKDGYSFTVRRGSSGKPNLCSVAAVSMSSEFCSIASWAHWDCSQICPIIACELIYYNLI